MYTSYLAKTAESNSPSSELAGGGRHCFCAFAFVANFHTPNDLPNMKTPPKFFWGVACFVFPRSLSFDFCYDFDLWAQGQALHFCSNVFYTILPKV